MPGQARREREKGAQRGQGGDGMGLGSQTEGQASKRELDETGDTGRDWGGGGNPRKGARESQSEGWERDEEGRTW